jgi:8-oxo-dGTP diphosphatase
VKLIPVALALFHRRLSNNELELWVQERTDEGPYQGLLEFPGGGIEKGETPFSACVREVQEEVGIDISAEKEHFMGIYRNEHSERVILLYVFLFRDVESLEGKGEWLRLETLSDSENYRDKIPGPNHRIIEDLFRFYNEVIV